MWNPWHRPRPANDKVKDMILSPVSSQAVYDICLEIISPQLAGPHSDFTSTIRPGEAIAGNVILRVLRPSYMNDITVELFGKCNVIVGKTPGLALDNGGDNTELFRPPQHILSAIPCELQPGQSYQWPFTTVLPMKTEYAMHPNRENVDRHAASRPAPWSFEDGQHPLPSSFHYGTQNDAGAKCWKSAKMMAVCEVSYGLSVKINRKYMPDHCTIDFPIRVVAHDDTQVPLQVYQKSLSMLERPLSSSHDGTHKGLLHCQVQMHVILPANKHRPMRIGMSVSPRLATKSKPWSAPPVLIGVQVQLQNCLRMRYNSGSKSTGLVKREFDTSTAVSATRNIPCYELLTEQIRTVVTDKISFDDMIQDSELAILTPVRTYTISHTYILRVTAKLKGPGHASKEYTFSQYVPWRLHWAEAPMPRTLPIPGPAIRSGERHSTPKIPKIIVSPEFEVANGTKSDQAKTVETTVTALDAKDDEISSATSSQLAFERGEEERRGLMPIYKAWWKKGIKDDDFRHM